MSEPEIELYSWREAVRHRPTLYVGPLSKRLVANNLLREAFCCARDDAREGRCSRIDVTLGSNGVAMVRDDGPGLPLTRNRRGQLIAETYFLELGGCSSAKPPAVADTVCLAGLAVLNALSAALSVRIFADGAEWSQFFVAGAPMAAMARVGASNRRGTEISFQLDRSIIPHCEFNFDELAAWAASSGDGVSYGLSDSRSGRSSVIYSQAHHVQPA